MKHLKHLFLLLAMIIAFNNIANAQFQKRLWSLQDYYVKFNPGPGVPISLPVLDYTGAWSTKSHNAINDANGDLLFFVTEDGYYPQGTFAGNAIRVFDKEGRYIGMPSYNGLPVEGGSEIAIVPVPNDCNKYYLFFSINSCLITNCVMRFGFLTLDMSLQNTYGGYGVLSNNGAVTVLKSFTHTDAKFDDTFFAVTTFRPTISNGSRILFAKNNGRIWKFLITETAVTEITAYSGNNNPFFLNANCNFLNELEVITLANGNYRLGMVNQRTTVAVADFYPTGEYIPNTLKSINYGLDFDVYGIEFDLSGRYLYIAQGRAISLTSFQSQLGYTDVTAATPSVTPLYVPNATNGGHFGHGQIELGPDNTLYFAAGASLGLNTDGSPNTATWNPSSAVAVAAPYFLNDQVDGESSYPTRAIDPTKTIVYLNNKTENAVATYSSTSYTIANVTTYPPAGTTFIYVVNGTYTINAYPVSFNGCQTYFAPDTKVI
ncbi:MAG: hypothetical protein ACT4ON_07080, partial [Bacteroidota bacterium]